MTTPVQICNLALARIAISDTINALDETSQEAVTCNLHYEQVRDAVLRDFSWPFATRFITLPLVEETPTTEWLYSYRTPADFIRAVRIIPDLRTARNDIPYRITSDSSGQLIFTDREDAKLEYVAKIEDTNLYSADFIDALSWRIASDIALPLAQSTGIAQNALREYMMAIDRARTNAYNEEKRDPELEAESIAVRTSEGASLQGFRFDA